MVENQDLMVEKALNSLQFNAEGLIPAIAQQYDTGEVLMLAWMNANAIITTLQEKRVVFWSRSRKTLWRKGDTSGQVQILKELRWDCDGDTILLQVDQSGVACHTGRRNCFFTAVRHEKIEEILDVEVNPDKLYK
jgi:phosphoribosyl-AMP cyclohydrolase